jgi:hypothetical protein
MVVGMGTEAKPGSLTFHVTLCCRVRSSYHPNQRSSAPVRPQVAMGGRMHSGSQGVERQPERLLFIGWRRDMADMIRCHRKTQPRMILARPALLHVGP